MMCFDWFACKFFISLCLVYLNHDVLSYGKVCMTFALKSIVRVKGLLC